MSITAMTEADAGAVVSAGHDKPGASRPAVIRAVTIAALVVALEVVCRMGWVKPGLVIPPSLMVTELFKLVQTTPFWATVWSSTRSIAIAFTSAMVVGSMVGLVLHSFPRARDAVEPLIASWYALPFFVVYPLLIVLMGMNQKPIILIGFLYAVMAVIIGVLNGLDRIPSVFVRTGRIMRMNGLQQAMHVSLPAAAPYVFTGGKLAFGYSITGVLGSEFILATAGYGYNIAFAYNNFDDRRMYALLLFLLLVVSLLTALMQRASRAVEHRSGAPRAPNAQNTATVLSKLLATFFVFMVLLGLWQWGHSVVGSEALAAPVTTFHHTIRLLGDSMFWGNVRETFRALGFALLISCAAGAVLGSLVGMSRTATAAVQPVLVTLYAMPKVALYPVVLLFFGVGMSAKVVFGAMYGLIPMMLIVINAIQSMNQTLPKTARVLRLSRMQTLGTVIIPAMAPEVVTGMRISFSITFLGVMIGEMFASNRGLGYMLMNSININDTATIMGVTLLVAIFAVTVNAALLALDKVVHRRV